MGCFDQFGLTNGKSVTLKFKMSVELTKGICEVSVYAALLSALVFGRRWRTQISTAYRDLEPIRDRNFDDSVIR